MDFLQLKYFQTVARLEHMTKAANQLQIAQPALSVTIARLEDELGVPLFNRTGRNIVLNEYGRTFLQRVDKILRELEAARQEILDQSGSECGSVSFASASLNKEFSNVIGSFAQLYPKVNFRITQISDDKIKYRLLETDEIDFAFINTADDYPNIAKIRLMEEDVFLAVSPNHRLASHHIVTFGDLTDEPFISLNTNHGFREYCGRICKENGFNQNIICECSETSALINLVETGLGVSFFASSANEKRDLPIVLLKIEGVNFKNTLQLAWWRKRYFSKAALNFREYIIQYFNTKFEI